jgi:hypothetical protein
MTTWYSIYHTPAGVRVKKRGTDENNDLSGPLPPQGRPNVDSAFHFQMDVAQIEAAMNAGQLKELAELNRQKQLLVALEENNGYRAWIVQRDVACLA